MTECHISSLVVSVTPENMDAAAANVAAEAARMQIQLDVIEKSFEKGKLVLVLECGSTRQIDNIISFLNQQNGVYSASMIYHQIEQEDALNTEISQ